jgi:shikimate dehydrogenase
MITGLTSIIPLIGYPTHAFKAPMIYNPYFEHAAVDAVVVPMGCKPEHFAPFFTSVLALDNVFGAMITMPHKVGVADLVDEVTPAAKIAGACNVVRRGEDGRLIGNMSDGDGFVRGVRQRGCRLEGARALVVGAGGVGSAIAASLAAAGVAGLGLYDARAESAEALGDRLAAHYPKLKTATGSNDPAGYDLVVNATPMGMNNGDPLPIDVERISPETFFAEVVMTTEMTAFLKAAQMRGCRFQVGSDMLFEQIPANLEFLGFPATTADVLRSVSKRKL